MSTKFTNSIRKFHSDEEGLEALQVVMIIAIAAMVMIACATLGKTAVGWMQGKWTTLQGLDPSGRINTDDSYPGLGDATNQIVQQLKK